MPICTNATRCILGMWAPSIFPTARLTIVPLALALGTVTDSAQAAVLLAANIGGDSDSVASIAGAIVGARCPETVNEHWYAAVEMVNGHDLTTLAKDLSGLRC
jgi:ADP-ribosylglycohydrolase